MKKATGFLTDNELKKRIEDLKSEFANRKENYIDFGDYYIELRKNDDGEGVRWFHRDKYKVEVVFNREYGPAQNVAGFVLFSNIEDALLHAVLCEESELRKLKKSNTYPER